MSAMAREKPASEKVSRFHVLPGNQTRLSDFFVAFALASLHQIDARNFLSIYTLKELGEMLIPPHDNGSQMLERRYTSQFRSSGELYSTKRVYSASFNTDLDERNTFPKQHLF